MGRYVEDPCNYIVSCRLNEKDFEKLNYWSETTDMSLSMIMRKAIQQMDIFFNGNPEDSPSKADSNADR